MQEASELQAEEAENLRIQTKIEFDEKVESERRERIGRRERILLDRSKKIELQKDIEARLESIEFQNKIDDLLRAVWKDEEDLLHQ